MPMTDINLFLIKSIRIIFSNKKDANLCDKIAKNGNLIKREDGSNGK